MTIAGEEPRGPDSWLWPDLSPRTRTRRAHIDARRRRVERRGPRGRERHALSLSREQIVRAAIEIADAEGPQALSMRRIAAGMRVGTMSLYWHVVDKEELLLLMLDTIQGEVEMPDPQSGDWRADLRTAAHNTRRMLLRHPWVKDHGGMGPPLGPNAVRHVEASLQLLAGLGLDMRATMDILMAVDTYVMGAVLRQLKEDEGRRQQSVASDEERQAYADRVFATLRETGRYPQVVRLFDADVDPDSPYTIDERFEFGLECLLGGIAARIGTAGRDHEPQATRRERSAHRASQGRGAQRRGSA
ncbi:MAG: TetR/AcrR family transcriptional regulator [Streptosporangiaceae bacterium]